MEALSILTPFLLTAFGMLFAVIVELVPMFARWWDALPNEQKRSVRGWTGLVITVLMALGHYFGLYDLGVGIPVSFMGILTFVVSWVFFVTGGEFTYQSTQAKLPRKNEKIQFISKTHLAAKQMKKELEGCCEEIGEYIKPVPYTGK